MTPKLPSSPGKKSTPAGGTLLALFAVLACVVGFIALTSMILPQIQGVVMVGAAFGAFVALHYFTWGRWLMARLEREQLREQQEAQSDHRE